MSLPRDKAWFGAKSVGWGWGLPLRWQGWVVLIVMIVALVAGSPLASIAPWLYSIYAIALVGAFIGICFWKGEKPEWR